MLKFDVFLAHNSKDKDAVEVIARTLRRRRITAWFDAWQIPPGRPFQYEMDRGLRASRCVAVFVGRYGLGAYQYLESQVGIDRFTRTGARVIPVLLPGVHRSKIPPVLRMFRAVEFRTANDAQAVTQLLWGIRGSRPQKAHSRRQIKRQSRPR